MARALNLKLPSLWTDNIDAWFTQAEAQFALLEITNDNTKFHHVIISLDSATAKRLNHVICNPPRGRKYETLKEQLLKKFGLTSFERAAAIQAITGLGEWKPTELMDHMLALLGPHTPDLMFIYHFFQCLPDYVRATLSNSTETDPLRLAEEADWIFVAGRPRDTVLHEIDSDPNVQGVTNARAKKGRNNKPRASHKSDSTSSPGLCFYHARFGAEAHRCSPPCTWSGNEVRGQRQ